MRPIDAVAECLRSCAKDMDTTAIAEAVYPDMADWERNTRRCMVYAKLRKLEKYGLIESVKVSTPMGGQGLRVWRWVGA